MKKHLWFNNIWTFKIHDKDGNLVYDDSGRNALVDEGEEWVLRSAFRLEFGADSLYVRFCNQVLTETSTLSSITTEPPTANGYNPASNTLERSSIGFPTIDYSDGDARLTSKIVAVTAAGASIGPISTVFLATSPGTNGRLLAFRSLPITQTILDGNSGTVSFRLKLS